MKSFLAVALAICVSFGMVGRSFAQQEVAPLVHEETTVIMRVNLGSLEADEFTASLQELSTAAIDYFVKDQENAEQLKQLVPLGQMFVEQFFTQYAQPLKDANAKSVYIVIEQSENMAVDTLYPYIAIPTKGMSETDLQDARKALAKLNDALKSTLKFRFVRNGFLYALITPSYLESEDVKDYTKARFSKPGNADATAFIEGFKNADPEAILNVVTYPNKNTTASIAEAEKSLEELRETLSEVDPSFQEVVEQLSQLLEKAVEFQKNNADRIIYGVANFNLKKFEINSKVELKSDAQSYLDECHALSQELKSTILSAANVLSKQEDLPVDAATINDIASVINELIDAYTALPQAQDNAIVMKFDRVFWQDNQPTVDKLIKIIQDLRQKFTDENDEDDEDDEIDEDDVEDAIEEI
ncbi:MAG: hypothetical protein Q4G03_00765 [Planctomycetia bacterium]|nr:hypothetical protein [Planctomycetia bacterium]